MRMCLCEPAPKDACSEQKGQVNAIFGTPHHKIVALLAAAFSPVLYFSSAARDLLCFSFSSHQDLSAFWTRYRSQKEIVQQQELAVCLFVCVPL